jgi:hypothetical protein
VAPWAPRLIFLDITAVLISRSAAYPKFRINRGKDYLGLFKLGAKRFIDLGLAIFDWGAQVELVLGPERNNHNCPSGQISRRLADLIYYRGTEKRNLRI